MPSRLVVELDWPDDEKWLRLPEGVGRRLQYLLDKQDLGAGLTTEERSEAEGLVELSEFLSLLRLRAQLGGD
jgi:hypothetical protein